MKEFVKFDNTSSFAQPAHLDSSKTLQFNDIPVEEWMYTISLFFGRNREMHLSKK